MTEEALVRTAFRRDGIVVLRGLLDRETIEALREAAVRHLRGATPDPSGLTERRGLWQDDETLRAFVLQSPVAAAAAAVMQCTSVRFFFDRLAVKGPGATHANEWHRDLPYWPVAGRMIVTAGVVLDPVRFSTGGLAFIPGSQSGSEARPHTVSWDMKPGDCHLYNAMLMHRMGSSEPGPSRHSYVTRWLGDDARYDPRPGTDASLEGRLDGPTIVPAVGVPDWSRVELVEAD